MQRNTIWPIGGRVTRNRREPNIKPGEAEYRGLWFRCNRKPKRKPAPQCQRAIPGQWRLSRDFFLLKVTSVDLSPAGSESTSIGRKLQTRNPGVVLGVMREKSSAVSQRA